jgi:hypothetical protein
MTRAMKPWLCALSLLMLTGCCGARMSNTLGISMMLQNHGQTFVTQKLAERWAKLILEEKYPLDIFTPGEAARVQDDGEFWVVSFDNKLQTTQERPFVSRRISIKIRKSNGEIDEIS